MPRGSRSPGFSPPDWPRLGRRPSTVTAVGGLAPAPTQIPLCWLSQPVRLRLEPPINTGTVTQAGGLTATASDRASVLAYTSYSFTADLQTACAADPENLASWTVAYNATPRTRSPQLTIDLLYRTDAEKQLLLTIARNRRIVLTGVPPEFPEGAWSLIVAGIRHEVGVARRRMHITTRAVTGAAAGVPGPWFRLGSSSLGGTDVIPF